MNQNQYPFVNCHTDINCFQCGLLIGNHKNVINYGFPKGKYGMWCDDCKMRTYYDTNDSSIKFDKKGSVIHPCMCGDTTPYSEWIPSYDGDYPRCPNCGTC